MVLIKTILVTALSLFSTNIDAQLVEKKYSSFATDQKNLLRH